MSVQSSLRSFQLDRRIAAIAAAFALIGAGFPDAAAQSLFQNNGGQDLILGFRAGGGFGKDNSVIVNLGPFATTNSFASFTLDLGTYLNAAYGGTWASRTDLFWGVVGVELATDHAPDAWLSRTAGTPPPLIYDTTALSEDQLYSIQGAVPVIVDLTRQSAPYSITNASVADSAGTNHAVSVNSEAVIYGWKYYLENKFGIFSDFIDSPVQSPNSLLVSYYAPGTDPVGMMNVTRTNGIFTFGSPVPADNGGPSGYAGPWNWAAASGNWSATNNWTNGQAASNNSVAAITGSSGGRITNDAVETLSGLTFAAGAGAFTLTGTNASQSLTVTGGITNSSSATQTIDLTVAGAGGVTQSGAGTLVLARSNSYAGGTLLGGGAVVIGNNAALGSGAVTVSGASSLIAGVNVLSTTNPVVVNAPASLDTGTNRWNNSGVLSGSGPVSKTGSGTITFAAASTNFSGNVTVSLGTLQVAPGSSLGSGTVTVAPGSALSGAGTVGAVSLSSNAILTGGIDGGTGRLSVSGNMTLSPGGIMNWKMADANGSAGSGFDSFDIRGTLDLTGLTTGATLRFNILNGAFGTANFLNNQSSQWLVASAGSISGFSADDFSISTSGFTNALGGGAFGFITNATGLFLKFTALGVDPWTGNLAAGSSPISGSNVISTNAAVIGGSSSRNGGVTVSNGGSWIIQGGLTVGGTNSGNGTLTIGSGGQVSANSLKISDLKGSKGLVLVTNGASSPLSLGTGSISFGSGNGTLQFAQSNAVTLSNAVSGRGTISFTGVGTTTLSGNQSGFAGTNYLSSGRVVLAAGATNAGVVNIAGKTASLNLNTNAVLSSSGTHAVAGLLLDNSGLAFTNAVRGQVVLSPTGVLQKTYATNQSVAGFGAGIGAGKSFSILAGTAASNGTNTPVLQARMVNGQLDFHGTTTNAIVMSMKDPSFSPIRNQIKWLNTNVPAGTAPFWTNTVAGNTGNVTNAISGMNGRSFAGSFSTFLLRAKDAGILTGAEDTLAEINAMVGSQINLTLAKIMGAFGYDAATKTSWAVINHNSIFGNGSSSFKGLLPGNDPVVADLSVFNPVKPDVQAVPEPGTWALMILSAALLMLRPAWRKFLVKKGLH